jgi:energy-converting hydrogenase B subunit Q
MAESAEQLALLVRAAEGPGILAQLTRVLAEHGANIARVDIVERAAGRAVLYFELEFVADVPGLVGDLTTLPPVEAVEQTQPFAQIYGKRVIVIGGGAQVGQVMIGAVSEADRHNIRGERISVDTIPLVGEAALADAVRAVARLPRARALVLAGALMGGEITRAVRDLRAQGFIVISLNMAGSVPEAADLVVSDPVQAGVMAVMAVADTAQFNIARQAGRRY